jgi:transposase-like protein
MVLLAVNLKKIHSDLSQLLEAVKAGKHRTGVERWKCQQCGKRFQDAQQKPFGADGRLPQEKVCQILHCLVEGNRVRGTARLCDVEKLTVLHTLKLAGDRCQQLLTEKVRGVTVGQPQADEIWTFVKQGHLTPSHDEATMGDAYTYIALDRSTKLVVAFGKRDRINAEDFISKVRLATEDDRTFDICTDGFEPYPAQLQSTFLAGIRISFLLSGFHAFGQTPPFIKQDAANASCANIVALAGNVKSKLFILNSG